MSNVILIGYMGCGKSTIGKKLSFRMKMPYLDTDKLIENEQKTTISHIFETQGENAFRDMETRCIKKLFENKQDYVISVGGGLPLREENRLLLSRLGQVVYLRATPETIYSRLKGDKTRPLLQGDDPQGKIHRMIKERGPVYEQASQIIVDVDGKSCEEIMNQIVEEVGK